MINGTQDMVAKESAHVNMLFSFAPLRKRKKRRHVNTSLIQVITVTCESHLLVSLFLFRLNMRFEYNIHVSKGLLCTIFRRKKPNKQMVIILYKTLLPALRVFSICILGDAVSSIMGFLNLHNVYNYMLREIFPSHTH